MKLSDFPAWLDANAELQQHGEVEDFGLAMLAGRNHGMCKRCHIDAPLNDDGYCEDCAATLARGYEISQMAGRDANGHNANRGHIFHARLIKVERARRNMPELQSAAHKNGTYGGPKMNNKLMQYEELVARIDMMKAEMARLIDAAIPPEVKAEIDAIEAEIEPEIEELQTKADALSKELKHHVASTGKKIIGERFQVIYLKPRVSWDSKALEGYGAAHPEIFAFQKVGKPSASIRMVRK